MERVAPRAPQGAAALRKSPGMKKLIHNCWMVLFFDHKLRMNIISKKTITL
jgi:hypothetical protein